jgi:predicted NAD/FAD-dependent oxidoreductase
MKRIAVIGAGLSGLVFARSLGDSAAITLFEKSRGYGGRIIGKWVSLCGLCG